MCCDYEPLKFSTPYQIGMVSEIDFRRERNQTHDFQESEKRYFFNKDRCFYNFFFRLPAQRMFQKWFDEFKNRVFLHSEHIRVRFFIPKTKTSVPGQAPERVRLREYYNQAGLIGRAKTTMG